MLFICIFVGFGLDYVFKVMLSNDIHLSLVTFLINDVPVYNIIHDVGCKSVSADVDSHQKLLTSNNFSHTAVRLLFSPNQVILLLAHRLLHYLQPRPETTIHTTVDV